MSKHRFTLTQVVDAERPAWHETSSGAVDYTYDGIHFWHGDGGGREMVNGSGQLPREGWRHKADCRCAACRETRKAARAKRRRR